MTQRGDDYQDIDEDVVQLHREIREALTEFPKLVEKYRGNLNADYFENMVQGKTDHGASRGGVSEELGDPRTLMVDLGVLAACNLLIIAKEGIAIDNKLPFRPDLVEKILQSRTTYAPSHSYPYIYLSRMLIEGKSARGFIDRLIQNNEISFHDEGYSAPWVVIAAAYKVYGATTAFGKLSGRHMRPPYQSWKEAPSNKMLLNVWLPTLGLNENLKPGGLEGLKNEMLENFASDDALINPLIASIQQSTQEINKIVLQNAKRWMGGQDTTTILDQFRQTEALDTALSPTTSPKIIEQRARFLPGHDSTAALGANLPTGARQHRKMVGWDL